MLLIECLLYARPEKTRERDVLRASCRCEVGIFTRGNGGSKMLRHFAQGSWISSLAPSASEAHALFPHCADASGGPQGAPASSGECLEPPGNHACSLGSAGAGLSLGLRAGLADPHPRLSLAHGVPRASGEGTVRAARPGLGVCVSHWHLGPAQASVRCPGT